MLCCSVFISNVWWNSIPSISQLFPAVIQEQTYESLLMSACFSHLSPSFSPYVSQVFPYLPKFFSIFSHVVSPYFLMFSHIFSIYIGFFHGFSHEILHFSWVFPRFSHVFRWLSHVFSARCCRYTTCWTWQTWRRRWAELVGGTQRQNARGFLWIFPMVLVMFNGCLMDFNGF